jgi:peroxiredoxin
MRSTAWLWFTGLVLLAWAALLGVSALGNRWPQPPRPPAPRAELPQTHHVTPKQLTAAGSLTDRPAPMLDTLGHDGRRPLVVVFLKAGCPCSPEMEPFFHRLHRLYQDPVRFAAVIDGPDDVARAYAADNRVPYPVLADPAKTLIRHYHAENSAYVVLIDPRGRIDALWPGVSADMMHELGRRAARLAGVAEAPVDTRGLPAALTTGCPFFPASGG